jgi:flagellar hook assembly protein FlgD
MAYFRFDVTSDPPGAFNEVTARVKITDGSNVTVIRTLEKVVGKGASNIYRAHFQWDGKDNNGKLVPAGDYGPFFEASANEE